MTVDLPIFKLMLGRYLYIIIVVFYSSLTPMLGQGCQPLVGESQSPSNANYKINLELDEKKKTIHAQQKLTWINLSPDTISEMRMYLYLNAFRNLKTTYLKPRSVFGEDISNRPDSTFGWIDVREIIENGKVDISHNQSFAYPDDDNPDDQSVLAVALSEPLNPGDTVVLDMKFVAKLPQIISRVGYSKDNFFNVVHWFPQAGVYEANADGEWNWNCHQFMQRTEFYADFGEYLVKIRANKDLIVGASGCLVDKVDHNDGTITHTYHGQDIIDFAWTAYPCFEVFEETWKHVNIRLLVPPEHANLAHRFLDAVTHALDYLTENVGPYPYTTLTMMDPPMHGLRSGFMEYPTYITLGSFHYFPGGVRSIESLVIHEFTHQYFMGMLASNEKEHAWLDEGFVTYYEDRIMEAAYGADASLVDYWRYKFSNSELTRLEYTRLEDPSYTHIARPSWEIDRNYKAFVYSKTGTILRTLERSFGVEIMDEIMKDYFDHNKFTHPREDDFINVVKAGAKVHGKNKVLGDLDYFFNEALHGTSTVDYQAIKENEKIKVSNLGGFAIPTEVAIYTASDSLILPWDGKEELWINPEDYKGLLAIHIDPEEKIYLDLNLNNNSFTLKQQTWSATAISLQVTYWASHVIQTLSFITF